MGLPARLPANREDEPMATKKQSAARTKFTKAARAKGKTKVGRAAAKRGKATKRK